MSEKTTIDPGERARFEKLSQLWWDQTGPFWPLHAMNALRTRFIRDQLVTLLNPSPGENEGPLGGLRILDIGCGGGILSESVARLGAEVEGVDMVERNVLIARKHALDEGLSIRYRTGTAEELVEQGRLYDAVLNLEVVEHVADLSLFMESCQRLVRPGGVMIIATLNRTLASFLAAIIGAEYLLRWLPRGTHRWSQFRKPDELIRILTSGGFQLVAQKGVRINPVTRRFTLIDWLGINYLLVAVKPESSTGRA